MVICDVTRLRGARELAGLTIGQAAKFMGIDRHRLEHFEHGRWTPTPFELRHMAATYDVRFDWLEGEVSSEAEILERAGLDPANLARLQEPDRAKLLYSLDAMG